MNECFAQEASQEHSSHVGQRPSARPARNRCIAIAAQTMRLSRPGPINNFLNGSDERGEGLDLPVLARRSEELGDACDAHALFLAAPREVPAALELELSGVRSHRRLQGGLQDIVLFQSIGWQDLQKPGLVCLVVLQGLSRAYMRNEKCTTTKNIYPHSRPRITGS
jgi:hypothetical protein